MKVVYPVEVQNRNAEVINLEHIPEPSAARYHRHVSAVSQKVRLLLLRRKSLVLFYLKLEIQRFQVHAEDGAHENSHTKAGNADAERVSIRDSPNRLPAVSVWGISPKYRVVAHGKNSRASHIPELGESIYKCQCNCALGRRTRNCVGDPRKKYDESGVRLGGQKPIARVRAVLGIHVQYLQTDIAGSCIHRSQCNYKPKYANSKRDDNVPVSIPHLVGMTGHDKRDNCSQTPRRCAKKQSDGAIIPKCSSESWEIGVEAQADYLSSKSQSCGYSLEGIFVQHG